MKPAVYTLVEQAHVSELLQTFHACTGLPIQMIGQHGECLEFCGAANAFCRLLQRHVFTEEDCQAAYRRAARQAQDLGQAYIFACHANLNHIVFPLCSRGTLYGAVAVGPFLMDAPDSTLVSALPENRPLPPAVLLDLYDELNAVPVISPERVSPVSRLLFFLFSPLIPSEQQQFLHNQEKAYQQSRISETIRMVKEQGVPVEDAHAYEREKELLDRVKQGDLQAAKGTLNELLGYVFFCEGGKMETMKNRAMELCTLLSRVAIEEGAATDTAFRLNNQFLSLLQRTSTLEELCVRMQEITEAFVDAVFHSEGQARNADIRQALRYVAHHYAEPLRLEEVARQVGLSPSYFSGLFRRCTGMRFIDYVNQVRVRESKRLLSGSDFAIVDIAVALGFGDQSYFSKVFKKHTGVSPKQYRREKPGAKKR